MFRAGAVGVRLSGPCLSASPRSTTTAPSGHPRGDEHRRVPEAGERLDRDGEAAKTGRLFTEMVYQPMLEALACLRANGFKTFVVSGGGVEFMRPWTERVYGIPPEQVIGSSFKMKFEIAGGTPVPARQGPGGGKGETLDGGEHEGRLGDRLPQVTKKRRGKAAAVEAAAVVRDRHRQRATHE